jgi:hypothetical protein
MGQKIIYDFPDTVTKVIIAKFAEKNDSLHCILLDQSEIDGNTVYTASLISFSPRSATMLEINNVLISNTSRYFWNGNVHIPIISEDDLTFGDFGSVMVKRPGSTKERRYRKKMRYLFDGPTIKFDARGRIYPN